MNPKGIEEPVVGTDVEGAIAGHRGGGHPSIRLISPAHIALRGIHRVDGVVPGAEVDRISKDDR